MSGTVPVTMSISLGSYANGCVGQPDGSYASLTGLIARTCGRGASDGGRAARAASLRLDGVRSTACGSGVVRAAHSASSANLSKLRNAGHRRAIFTTGEWWRISKRDSSDYYVQARALAAVRH